MSPDRDRVIAAERAARQEAGRSRARQLDEQRRSAPRVADAPPPPGRVSAGTLERGEDSEGRAAWLLDGVPLRVGEVVEVFANAANGWLRGRFEWGGGPEDPPRLALNVWDPNGPRDEDGLPPWVGELDARIPAGARVRRG